MNNKAPDGQYRVAGKLNELGYVVLLTEEGFEVRKEMNSLSMIAKNPSELRMILGTLLVVHGS